MSTSLYVSCLWHPRLSVHPYRLSRWPGDLHYPPRARDLPLFGLRFPPSVVCRGEVERRFRSLPIGSRATLVILPIPRVECQALRAGASGQDPFCRLETELY